MIPTPSRNLFAESLHTIAVAGDIWQANVVRDERRGLGVPGRALMLTNEAAVAMELQIASSGDDWSEPIYIAPVAGTTFGILAEFGVRITAVRIRALAANAIFTIVVFPGVQPMHEPTIPQPDKTSPAVALDDLEE